jgi:hypothetical protein
MGGETFTSGAYARSSGARGTLKGKIGTTHIWFYPSQSNDYPITTRKDSNNYFNDSLQIGPTTFQHVWANFNNFDVSGYYTKNKAALYLAKDVGIVGFRIFDPSKNDYRIFYLKESKIIPRKE